MRHLRSWTNGLFLLIPLCILGAGAYRFVRQIWGYLNSGARLAGVLSVEATRAAGREIRIGDVRLSGNLWSLSSANRLELRAVSIAEGPGAYSRPFAQADKVFVWYNLRQILFTQDLRVPLVNEVYLLRPQLSLSRSAAGHWNFETLFKPGAKAGRPFLDKLSLTGGTLFYEDRAFPHPSGVPARPLITRLDRAAGVVLIRPDKSAAFDVSAAGTPQTVRDLHAIGIADIARMQVDARLIARGVHLPFVGERLLPLSKGHLDAGYADLDVTALYAPPPGTSARSLDVSALDAHGGLQVFNLAAGLNQLGAPLTNVSGSATFTTDSVLANLRGRYGGTPVAASGSVLDVLNKVTTPRGTKRNVASTPLLTVQGSVQNTDIARLIRELGLKRHFPTLPAQVLQATGRGSAHFALAGTPREPAVTLISHLDAVQTGPFRAANVDVRGLYADKTVQADVRGKYAQGVAAIRAKVGLDKANAFEADVRGRNLALANVWDWSRSKIVPQGVSDLDFAIRGERGHTPNMSGQAQISGLKLNNETLQSVYARAENVRHNLDVRMLRVQDPKGFALAHGTVDLTTHAMNMLVESDELDFDALAKGLAPQTQAAQKTAPEQERFSLAGLVGYLRGRVTGTFDDPKLHGRLNVFSADPVQSQFDQADADFDFSREALVVSQGELLRYPGKLVMKGALVTDPLTSDYALNPDAGLDVNASVESVEVADLLHTAGVDLQSLSVTGTLFADVNVSGTAAAPRVALSDVRLEGATVNDLPVEDVSVAASYGPDGVEIGEARARLAGGSIRVTGGVDIDLKDRNQGENGYPLHLNIVGHDLRLEADGVGRNVARILGQKALEEKLNTGDAPLLAGGLDFQADIRGSTKDPAADVKADVRQLALNAVPLGELHGAVAYANRVLTSQDVKLTLPQNTEPALALTDLRYDMQTKQIEAAVNVTDIQLQKLRELAQGSLDEIGDAGKTALDLMNRLDERSALNQAHLALTGTADEPVLDITHLNLNLDPATQLTGTARLTKVAALIPIPSAPNEPLHLESGETVIEAKGRAEYDGEINAELNAFNVDLASLQKWVNNDIVSRLSGNGTVFVSASGQTKSPVLDVSISLKDIAYQDEKRRFTLNSFEVARATISEGEIRANAIQMAKNATITGADGQSEEKTFVARAQGDIEFTWKSPFIPDDAKFHLEASLLDQPIEALAALASGQPGAGKETFFSDSQGTFSISARIGGARKKPAFPDDSAVTIDPQYSSGTLAIHVPRLRFGALATGLSDINGTIKLQQNRLTVEDGFTATPQVYREGMPDPARTGTPITLSGSLPLGFGDRASEETGGIRLLAPKVNINESSLPGATGGSVRGVAQADIRLTGSLRRPTLGGDVTIFNTQAALPSEFGGLAGGDINYPLDPRFDLRVHLAPATRKGDSGVRLANSLLNARTEGDIRLTGRLSSPQIDGRLTLTEGRLTLPTARFTILPPGYLTLAYPVYELDEKAFGIDIDLRAQTSITAQSISGVNRRYRLIVTARGPISGATVDPTTGQPRLALNFQSDPPDLAVNQEELNQRVIGILGGVEAFQQLGRNPSQAFAEQLTTIFTQSVLPGLFDKPAEALGFEEIALGYDPIQHLTLTLTRQLIGRIYGTYTQSLSANQRLYNALLSYRFKDRYSLSYGIDQDNTQQILVGGFWRF
jgi:hypothetical protein